MTFKHDPNATMAKLEPGIYRFQILDAQDKVSKKGGNAMLELKLGVQDPAAQKEQWVFDYLVDVPRMKHKTQQFCEMLGLDFQSGIIDSLTLLNRKGIAEFATQEQKGYDPKTVVQKYLTEEQAQIASAAPSVGSDIPF